MRLVNSVLIHALWFCRNFERYFVAIDEGRYYLESLGFPAEKITVSGIPIDPKFSIDKPKQEMRTKLTGSSHCDCSTERYRAWHRPSDLSFA
jgi:processive 1,2-diacylglycerol beta-glucosyltransferase